MVIAPAQGTHAQAAKPKPSSAPVAGVLSSRPARNQSADAELDDLQARFLALTHSARERKPNDPRLEPALTQGKQAIDLAQNALARGDQAALGPLKQIGWAAVAVLARVLALAEEVGALHTAQARADAARREREQAARELQALQAQLEALQGVQHAKDVEPAAASEAAP